MNMQGVVDVPVPRGAG